MKEAEANLKLYEEEGFRDGIDGDHLPLAMTDQSSTITNTSIHEDLMFGSVSGLDPEHARQVVNLNLQAVVLGYHKKDHIHYTQGSLRWQGISSRRRASRGQYPNFADCSSYSSWGKWCGFEVGHHTDVVNGEHWLAGFTGTEAIHGRRVTTLMPGDLVLYGHGPSFEHVTTYTGGGLCVSFGSEPGPFLLPVHYRPDAAEYRRYI